MKRTRVKICGIKTADTAKAAAAAGADAVGLVFVDDSPRHITLEQAKSIVAVLPPFVEPVGLFVDPPLDKVRQTAKALGLRTIQLHGKESPRFVEDLAPLRVIKALPFDARHMTDLITPWRTGCGNLCGILFDSPPKDEDSLTGGTGQTIAWADLAKLEHAGIMAGLPPIILAGGLTPQNVTAAITTVRPFAVDVSSGVESSRGVKDAQLIATFVRAVSEASQALNTNSAVA